MAKFLVVGGAGAVVNSSALLILHELAGVPLLLATPLAVELAIVNNFIWNDRWTFRRQPCTGTSLQRFAQFNAISLIGLLIATSTTLLLVQELSLQYVVSNLCGVGLAAACNFFANARWTWGVRARSGQSENEVGRPSGHKP